MSRRNRFMGLIVLTALLLGSCGRATTGQPSTPFLPPAPTAADLPTSTIPLATPTNGPTAIPPTDVTAAAELAARLQEAQQRWQELQIASYRLTVLEIHSIWWAQRMTFTITDGHVVDQQSMCVVAPSQGKTCTIRPVEQSNYMVPALLAQARDLIEKERPEYIRLAFEPKLGYPTMIGFDNPQILDEDYGLKIEKFEVLPGKPANELGQTVTLRIGEDVAVQDLRVTFVRIVEDSRCPTNVNCVWSGQAVVELSVSSGNNSPETVQLKLLGTGMRLEPPTAVAQTWKLQLTSVTPYPASPDPIAAKEYRVMVQISK